MTSRNEYHLTSRKRLASCYSLTRLEIKIERDKETLVEGKNGAKKIKKRQEEIKEGRKREMKRERKRGRMKERLREREKGRKRENDRKEAKKRERYVVSPH